MPAPQNLNLTQVVSVMGLKASRRHYCSQEAIGCVSCQAGLAAYLCLLSAVGRRIMPSLLPLSSPQLLEIYQLSNT